MSFEIKLNIYNPTDVEVIGWKGNSLSQGKTFIKPVEWKKKSKSDEQSTTYKSIIFLCYLNQWRAVFGDPCLQAMTGNYQIISLCWGSGEIKLDSDKKFGKIGVGGDKKGMLFNDIIPFLFFYQELFLFIPMLKVETFSIERELKIKKRLQQDLKLFSDKIFAWNFSKTDFPWLIRSI